MNEGAVKAFMMEHPADVYLKIDNTSKHLGHFNTYTDAEDFIDKEYSKEDKDGFIDIVPTDINKMENKMSEGGMRRPRPNKVSTEQDGKLEFSIANDWSRRFSTLPTRDIQDYIRTEFRVFDVEVYMDHNGDVTVTGPESSLDKINTDEIISWANSDDNDTDNNNDDECKMENKMSAESRSDIQYKIFPIKPGVVHVMKITKYNGTWTFVKEFSSEKEAEKYIKNKEDKGERYMSKAARFSKLLEDSISKEAEIISKIISYVKDSNFKVPSPDYLTTKSYSPQWKIFGNVKYYQTPKSDGSKIIAIISDHQKVFKFDPNGNLNPGNK